MDFRDRQFLKKSLDRWEVLWVAYSPAVVVVVGDLDEEKIPFII